MNTVEVDVGLLKYLISYLTTDHKLETEDFYNSTWKVGIDSTVREMQFIIDNANNRPHVAPGQRQIMSNPNRTDVGMGAVLNSSSEFI
jgi:hypothetical protein